MDIFTLTKTPFFQKLQRGLLHDDLSVEVNDFILCVHEVTNPNSKDKEFMLDALVIADIEFKKIKDSQMAQKANAALVAAIESAHRYVQYKIETHKSELPGFIAASTEEGIKNLTLNWRGNKTEFMELCYALKIGRCFSEETTASEIVRTLSRVFNVQITPEYAKKRFHESKYRSKKRSTAFLEKLLCSVRNIFGMSTDLDDLFGNDDDDEEDAA